MNTNQKIFLIINIIGGILVLGSYYLGLRGGKGVDALWGGTPANIKGIYTASMLVCAVSYFIFFSYIFSNLGSGTFSNIKILGDKIFLILFALILIASAFWMPLTNIMISNPSPVVWIGIRVVLVIVGLASCAVFLSLLTISPRPGGIWYFASLLGMFWFTFHTLILDALLWPYFWSK